MKRISCLLLSGWVTVAACNGSALEIRPPNFIIILADDMGYADLGCFGSTRNRTPHLDRLAAEGMKFTDFHVVSSACSASRAGLMTGCYPKRIGMPTVLNENHRIGLNPEEQTLAELLKKRGYATACIGKWHLGHQPEFLPTAHGFDSYYGLPYSNDMDKSRPNNHFPRDLDIAWKDRTHSFTNWNVPLMRNAEIIERPANQNLLTSRYTDESIAFIDQHKEQPFFLYLAYSVPHVPLYVSDPFYDPDPKQAYRLAVEELDDSVGRILAAIQAAGLRENTYVLFLSDNGPWLTRRHHGGCALPLRDGKASVYEGGLRVPCILRAPGQTPPGTICSEMVTAMDVLPSFAEWAGAALPERKIDGRSIVPLMQGTPGARSPHQAFYYYDVHSRITGVRTGCWKLLMQKNGPELYDLQSDIGESNNLAIAHPERVTEMSRQMEEFDRELAASARPVGKIAR